jgi:uroporphyrinogen III methyltransferase / synthase
MRVIVTRPRAQAEPLASALRARAFEPVLFPVIEVEPTGDEPIDVRGYDWVIVTSANGAAELARRAEGRPARIAAVGEATAAALGEHGLRADFVPSLASQDGLLAEFPRPAGRALFVGAEGARPTLAQQLPAEFRPIYRTVPTEVGRPPAGDLVLLASASAARAWGALASGVPAITIGPQTTEAARAAGVDVVAEARTQSTDGLVDSAAAWRASSRS